MQESGKIKRAERIARNRQDQSEDREIARERYSRASAKRELASIIAGVTP